MKKHRKWTTIIGYCKNFPLDKAFLSYVKMCLKSEKNLLIMIKKEDPESNPKYTAKEKFEAICKKFPNETKTGKIIISTVPDIEQIVEMEF